MAKAEKIALWMRSQLSAAGARGFVVGLSGGLDSAVVARLAQMAAPGAVLAVFLPCHSDPQDERDARLVASKLSLRTPCAWSCRRLTTRSWPRLRRRFDWCPRPCVALTARIRRAPPTAGEHQGATANDHAVFPRKQHELPGRRHR